MTPLRRRRPSQLETLQENTRRFGTDGTDVADLSSEAGIFPATLPDLSYRDLLATVEHFAADLVVADEWHLTVPLMAAALGLPWVPLAVTKELAPGVRLAQSRGLSRQHTDRRLAATPSTARIHTWPSWLQERGFVQPTGVLTMQTRPYDGGGLGHTAPVDVPVKRGGCPTVLVTLGTVVRDVDLLARVVEAVASLGVDVLVTAPPGEALVLPAPLSESGRVRSVGFVPMQRLLEDVSVVVSAGGAGTILACLGAAIPMALLPVLADQPLDAAAVAQTGAGLVCQTPAQLTAAVTRLLDEPGFALAAEEQATRLSAEVVTPEASGPTWSSG